MASSPSGEILATACEDNLIRIWDANSFRLLHNLRGHQGRIESLCYSPDGSTLASASQDGTTRVWDVSDLGARVSRDKMENADEEPMESWSFLTTGGGRVSVDFGRPASAEEIE